MLVIYQLRSTRQAVFHHLLSLQFMRMRKLCHTYVRSTCTFYPDTISNLETAQNHRILTDLLQLCKGLLLGVLLSELACLLHVHVPVAVVLISEDTARII